MDGSAYAVVMKIRELFIAQFPQYIKTNLNIYIQKQSRQQFKYLRKRILKKYTTNTSPTFKCNYKRTSLQRHFSIQRQLFSVYKRKIEAAVFFGYARSPVVPLVQSGRPMCKRYCLYDTTATIALKHR
ncbi:Hypothetical_protein [Hexamita inflata]|uniref:Hypothetical_protein n=1 Tax=Hexamita inflata TaxID=28002 RepID=A0AA86V6K7_9EUKA|nr:Hypothetical protein HINF_LOCUS45753 [Hexamita inflata]CAI9958110.1 Hypothetical protein HINF_LOCUS45755 [Hexamita inflata]CAI9958112.1 Hypothetical protein HINF_LOCUS45757 [Hexamita inflata]